MKTIAFSTGLLLIAASIAVVLFTAEKDLYRWKQPMGLWLSLGLLLSGCIVVVIGLFLR